MKVISRIAFFAPALLAATSAAYAQDSVRHYTGADGREVIVRTGMPAPDRYGPKPTFAELDRNHDGWITRDEAEAFIPLANDFDYLAQPGTRISASQYARWDYR